MFPWTNVYKKLKKSLDEAHENPETVIKHTSVDDLFDSIKDYKPTIFDRLRWWFKEFSWDVYYFFKPSHKEIRDSIPKKYIDITELIRIVNFEFIKSFHDKEMDIIDWDATPAHKDFKDWINSSYQYITVERPVLETKLSNSYPKRGATGTHEEKYADVIRIETLIQDRDTEILTEVVKRREMFWS